MTISVPRRHQARWDAMNSLSKAVTNNFKLVRFGIPVTIFALSLLSSASSNVSFLGALLFAIIFTGAYIVAFYQEIPVEDANGQPNVGLPVLLSERLPKILQPGPFLGMPGMRIIFYRSSYINLDLTVDGVRTRLETAVPETMPGLPGIAHALREEGLPLPNAGGEVDVITSVTLEVKTDDPWALITLDQIGDLEGAENIFKDAIREDVRQIGRHLTWLEMAFATDLLSAKLIRDLTEKKGLGESDILIDPSEDAIRNYLTEAEKNGFPDAKGLSVKVRRLNVTGVIPKGQLAVEAERAAVEKLRRAGLIQNAKALGDAVKELGDQLHTKDTDGNVTREHGMTARELIDRIQVDEEGSRVSKTIKQVDIGDPQKVGNAIATALAAFAGRKD